jgi:hypothetical protein
MDEKLKDLIRILKIIIMIILAIIGLAVLLAYKMSVFIGNPGFRN